jgi:hypothetical protein
MMMPGTEQQQDLGCLMTTVGCPYQHLGHIVSQQHHPLSQQQGATIFFAGVTPIADASQLLSVFAHFGRVMDLNLFRPYKACRTSKVKTGWSGWCWAAHNTLHVHDMGLFVKVRARQMVAEAAWTCMLGT